MSVTLMGVVNVTPDSFSDGGRFIDRAAAIRQALALVDAGADLVDIGGESTAPTAAPVGPEIEQARILPVIEALARRVPLSIDTFRAATARACLERGASVINDVSALRAEPEIAQIVKEYGARLVMMHSKEADGTPHATDRPHGYSDLIQGVGDFLARQVDTALQAGVAQDRLVLDPGWGKFLSIDPADSWLLLARFDELVERFAPIPLMVAASRKGFLGGKLAERDPVSALTAAVAVARGAAWVRAHDVAMTGTFLDASDRLDLARLSTPKPAR